MRRASPVLIGSAVAVVLVIASLWVRARLVDAADASTRGTGQYMLTWALPRLVGPPPVAPKLADAFAAYEPQGLRYIALVQRDDAAHPIAEAGEPIGEPSLAPVYGHEWSRMTQPLPPRAGLERGPPVLVVEYVDAAARALYRDAALAIPVAVLLGAMMIGGGLALARGILQRDALVAERERQRRLVSLGEMSAVLAHELRNPLTSLKGHAQLLEESLPAGSADAAKAARVVAEAVRLEALTRDLLELVRSGELRRVATDPAALLRVCADEVGARFELDAPASAPVLLDEVRLRQALVNILRNAAQATPAGAPPPRASVERQPTRVVFVVRDRGPGLPPGDEPHVFEPFFTTNVRGVGLGLAIARRVVELHGGSIRARTHPDGGAELRVELPVEAT